jgi:hypothetical protein
MTAGPKILIGYPYYRSDAYDDVEQMVLTYQRRLRTGGFDVEGFCLTLDPPGPRLSFPELDARWRRGDKQLLGMYERLQRALEGKQVLINEAGINLHPEFVESLSVLTVFQCNDDPESSADLSRPVASAYDLCLVGNIAEVDTYRRWGVRRAEWRPMGVQPEIYDPSLTAQQILEGQRDLDLFMMMDRLSPWRRARVEQLATAFPDAHFYGAGWPRGFLPATQQLASLRRAKIGPNLHNSTGPINYRTFYLPANGVLQICDNKSHLGKIYSLGEEAIGFDTVEECIDRCRYYLAHDEERRRIAAAGFERAVRDYTEVPVFQRVVDTVNQLLPKRAVEARVPDILVRQREKTRLRRAAHRLVSPIARPVARAMSVAAHLRDKVLRRR